MGIFTRVVDEILAHADRDHPREACGLLLGRDRLIEAAVPAANVAASPTQAFEIDPAVLLRAHRAAREGGSAVLGWYHSHPSGASLPSLCDSDRAVEAGRLWLIAANGAVHGFVAAAGGLIHGRFAPVRLERIS